MSRIMLFIQEREEHLHYNNSYHIDQENYNNNQEK